jgi:cysteinyl-tRNA synthetase
MALQLKNTLTGKLEPFRPLDPKGRSVTLYSCGPTVYSFAHIGNFRSFLLADILRRTLVRRGYDVKHVMNITDVGHMTVDHLADADGEDKLAKAARELGWDPFVVARHYETAFAEDAKTLGLLNYTGNEAVTRELHPQATRYVPEMLQLIQKLLDNGSAYTDHQGQVYFDISKFPEYGQLSGKRLDELDPGARVDVREEKRDPRDFALWKTDTKHLMQWDPHTGEGFEADDVRRYVELLPGGMSPAVKRGFPGWHIECSAMAHATLGATIDIHTGGEDNVFPHHECEIAQSCAGFGSEVPELAAQVIRSFARFWLHTRYLLVEGRKMSKRDGTFFTVRDLVDPESSGRSSLSADLVNAGFSEGKVPAAVLRYALISSSYQLPMNFSFELLTQARTNVTRVQSRYERLREVKEGQAQPGSAEVAAVQALVDKTQKQFDDALDNNLDVPRALAALGHFVTELNQAEPTREAAGVAFAFLEDLDNVLGLLMRDVRSGLFEKTALDLWADADYCKAQAAAWQAWSVPGAAGFLAELAAGALPNSAGLVGLDHLDARALELLLAQRQLAKKQRQFQVADLVRARFQALKVTIEDTATGVRWKLP